MAPNAVGNHTAEAGAGGVLTRVLPAVSCSALLDCTARKEAEETRDLLAGAMSHRVKNLFAIASSLTSIAARSAATTTEMERDLRQRLATPGRAHDLIRPVPGDSVPQAALFGDLFAPYDTRGIIGDRLRVTVPEVRVGEVAAAALALIMHGLATNSVKYGSLSRPRGTLDVMCAEDEGEIAVVWTERGGPRIGTPTGPGGFGSRLLERSLRRQLGGAIAHDWQPRGAVITLRMAKARLTF
ncbi:sensor histidine kinase [Dankookia rubra]|uniref:histidine kinase n=1 Tax=Dankookia rubra TaxID=1442381 RepID=A0A4R5QE74_9PROT|nr:sensor histidine kinase [Dankookia rubra]TDH60958.1 sensor histidine kinase [Dankookia rubra]